MKRVLSGFLIVLTLFSLFSCSPDEAKRSHLGTVINQEDIKTETDIHIRDKDLLYSQYDNTEIVTMYLTVSVGNEGEGTNHTWEEVNTYSAY